MGEKDLEDKENKELFDLINKGECIERLEKNEDFRILKNTWKELADIFMQRLINVDTSNKELIHEYQTIIKFYRNVLGSTVNAIKQESRLAFEEARERGLFDSEDSSVNAI